MKNILNRISRKLKVVLLVAIVTFVSNCTITSRIPVSQNMNLSNSYAVKVVEKKLPGGETRKNIRDPRAYYHYLMALRAVEGHQFEKASANFRKVVQFDPGSFKFSYQLAINLIRAGTIEDAYKTLEESLTRFPDSPELNMMKIGRAHV